MSPFFIFGHFREFVNCYILLASEILGHSISVELKQHGKVLLVTKYGLNHECHRNISASIQAGRAISVCVETF